jgi:hypothetical protein
MTTFIYTIDDMLKYLESAKADGYSTVIMAPDLHGMVLAPSKKTNIYRVPVAIAGEIWKTQSIGNLGLNGNKGSNLFIPLVLVHNSKEDQLSDEVIKVLNERPKITA